MESHPLQGSASRAGSTFTVGGFLRCGKELTFPPTYGTGIINSIDVPAEDIVYRKVNGSEFGNKVIQGCCRIERVRVVPRK